MDHHFLSKYPLIFYNLACTINEERQNDSYIRKIKILILSFKGLASRLPLLSSLIIWEVSALVVNNQVFELLTAKIQSANKAWQEQNGMEGKGLERKLSLERRSNQEELQWGHPTDHPALPGLFCCHLSKELVQISRSYD